MAKKHLTTANGLPVSDNQNSITAGPRGPIVIRFSTVGGETGSADTERDPRGFSIKFYTEEGN